MEKRPKFWALSNIGDKLFLSDQTQVFRKLFLNSQISFLVQFSFGKSSNTCVDDKVA